MYNRYIPQPDGSYRRNRMPDHHNQQPKAHSPASHPAPPCNPEPPPPSRPTFENNQPVTNFLKQLLPKNLDTSDLIIILLLLLMAGDCEENRTNALLTLALYFLL